MGLPKFKWSLALFGLCIYTFSVITYKLPLGQLGIAIGIVGMFIGRYSIRWPTPFWLYLAYLVWTLLASFASPFSSVALDEVIERFKLLVIMLLAMNTIRTEEQLRFYLLFILACFILFPARGTLLGGDSIQGRAVWNFIYSNPNDLAVLSLLALGVAIAIVLSETTWTIVRLGAIFSTIILLVVILLTQSRGVFLGLVIAIAPSLIPIFVKHLRLAISASIVLALILSFAIPSNVWDRLGGIQKLTSTDTIDEADPEGSAAERFEIQKVGWHIFLDNPFFGVGLGTYKLANNLYAPELGKRDTHNTYLNLAVETGTPGIMLWCTLVGSTLRHAYHVRRRARQGMLKIQQYWIERTFIGYLSAAVVGTYAGLSFPYILISILWCSANILAAKSPNPKRNIGAGRVIKCVV